MAAELIAPRISALSEAMNQLLAPELAQRGLTLSTFQLLTAVHSLGENAVQARVAESLGLSAPTLSEAVSTQVQRGLILQTDNPRDRRRKILKMTPKGIALLDEIRSLIQGLDSLIKRPLSAVEQAQFADCLDRMMAAIAPEEG